MCNACSAPDWVGSGCTLAGAFADKSVCGCAASQCPVRSESNRLLRGSERTRMGWTGRAPAPNGSQSAWGLIRSRSTTMPRKSTVQAVIAIGIDMGKNTLHMVGLDSRGAIVLRERVSRGRIGLRLANLPPCLIGIEAGMATHYVARELAAL